MPRPRRIGVNVCALLVGACAAGAAGVSPAASLGLPSVPVVQTPTVSTPTVPVKTPPVPVKVPTVPVKTPTVGVKTPPVPVKVPTVPVKTPTVGVKTPPVTVKTPAPPVKTPTVPVKAPTKPPSPPVIGKAPTVSVKAPSVAAKAPSVSVKAPGSSGGGPTVSLKGPAGSGTVPSHGAGAATSGGAGVVTRATAGAGGGSAPGGSGKSAPSGSLGAAYGFGPGYGELPPIEGAHGRHARARIAARERALKATVAQLRGCLSGLPERQRQLLELRTGLVSKPLGPKVVAARLHVARERFAALERQAVAELRATASAQGCGEPAEVAARVLSFVAAPFRGSGGAQAGTEAISFTFASPGPVKLHPSPGAHGGLLGDSVAPVAADAILALALLLAGAFVVTVVAADAAGQGPRHRRWRRRMAVRFPWLR